MALGVSEVCRVTMKGAIGSTIQIRNVFHLRNDSGGELGNAVVREDMERYLHGVYDHFIGHMGTVVTFTEFSVDNVSDDTKIADEVFSTAITGTATGQVLPTGVALVIRGATTVLKSQGRKFFAGMTEEQWDGSIWVGGLIVSAALAAADWVDTYVDGTSGNEYRPGIWRDETSTFISFSEGIVNLIAGYQRRRKEGVGI